MTQWLGACAEAFGTGSMPDTAAHGAHHCTIHSFHASKTRVSRISRLMFSEHGVQLEPNVLRIPIVPGSDPRIAYGDLVARGVRGIVLEAFGTGNMPDTAAHGWLPWLRQQTKAGLVVYLASQCLQVCCACAWWHVLQRISLVVCLASQSCRCMRRSMLDMI